MVGLLQIVQSLTCKHIYMGAVLHTAELSLMLEL